MISPEMSGAREFSYLWAVIIPGSIVVFSFLVTMWLYRRFAREHQRLDGKKTEQK